MFKSTDWSHKFLTVSAAVSLSDLIVGLKNVIPVSGNVSLKRVFSFRSLSEISLDVEWVASYVNNVSVFREELNVHDD